MLIVDDANRPRIIKGDKKEFAAAQLRDWADEQLANTVFIRDHETSPANLERQLGKRLTPAAFEAQLDRLNLGLIYEVNPSNATKKAIYQLRPDGRHYICTYENTLMPEHSIRQLKEDMVRDYDAVDFIKPKIDRVDLPKSEVRDGELKFEGGVPFGMKMVLVPWRELIRGWRTVLVRLVQEKVTSPAAIEAVFGSDNRPEWATYMGKQKHALLS
jgi:hypothetical protein